MPKPRGKKRKLSYFYIFSFFIFIYADVLFRMGKKTGASIKVPSSVFAIMQPKTAQMKNFLLLFFKGKRRNSLPGFDFVCQAHALK